MDRGARDNQPSSIASPPPFEMLFEAAEGAFQEIVRPIPGIELPLWTKFNEFTGGLRAHEITLLSAPTGAGKTQLNANLSLQLLMNRIPHFVASVETGRHDFIRRMVSAMEKKDYNDGRAHPVEEIKGVAARVLPTFKINNIAFSRYEDRVKISMMIESLKRVHDAIGAKVAILDNLNFFLQPTSVAMERAEFDDAIHEFVMVAKRELPMHIWLILHPRKTLNGRVESEFDIKGSATAVQEAANVMLWNRPTDADIRDHSLTINHRELKFCKIRKRGSSVGVKIFYQYNGGLYDEIGFEQHGKKDFGLRNGPYLPGMG